MMHAERDGLPLKDGPGLPNTRRGSQIPAPGFLGVQITGPSQIGPSDRLAISGFYVIPGREARAIDENLHRALVLVKASRDLYRVGNPFQDVVLFADDEERLEELRRGHFNIDAFDESDSIPPGTYDILVSLGGYLSNTVTVMVG